MDREDGLWVLDAEQYVNYQDLLVWRHPHASSQNGLLSPICPNPNPILAGDFVVGVNFAPGTVTACERSTGKQVWTKKAGRFVCYPAALTQTGVLICTTDELQTLAPESGKTIWHKRGFETMQPLVCGDQVLVADREGSIHCLDASTGECLWKQRVSRRGLPWMTPSVLGDMFITAVGNGQVKALSIETGEVSWSKKFRSAVSHGSDLSAGYAIVESQSKTRAINPQSGEIEWEFAFRGSEIAARCPAGYGMAYVISSNQKVAVKESPEMRYSPVYIVGLANGMEKWRLPYEPWPICRPIWSSSTGYIYEATRQGLGIIDPSTGKRTICITNFPMNGDLPDDAVDAPLVVDGMIYCHHDDGSLMALRHP